MNKKILAMLLVLILAISPMTALAFDETAPATYSVSVVAMALRTFTVTLKDSSCTTIQFKAKPGTNDIDPKSATGGDCQNATIPYAKLNNTGEVNANFSSAFSSDFESGINVTESNVFAMTGRIYLNSSYKTLVGVSGSGVAPNGNINAFIKANISTSVVEKTYPNSITFKNYLPVLQSITVTGPSPIYTSINGKKKYTAAGPDQFGNVYPIKPSWTSSNTTVGTMDQAGNLTVSASGYTFVNASDAGKLGDKNVTVTVLTAISISGPDTVYYTEGAANTYTYTLTGTKDDSSSVSPVPADSWTSSNVALATISANGILTVITSGSPTDIVITAKVGTLEVTKTVTVAAP